MNCSINSASNFSGLQAGISQISPAQLAASVRKSTLDRSFILPILPDSELSAWVLVVNRFPSNGSDGLGTDSLTGPAE